MYYVLYIVTNTKTEYIFSWEKKPNTLLVPIPSGLSALLKSPPYSSKVIGQFFEKKKLDSSEFVPILTPRSRALVQRGVSNKLAVSRVA